MEEFKSLIFPKEHQKEEENSRSVQEFSRYINKLNQSNHHMLTNRPSLKEEEARPIPASKMCVISNTLRKKHSHILPKQHDEGHMGPIHYRVSNVQLLFRTILDRI